MTLLEKYRKMNPIGAKNDNTAPNNKKNRQISNDQVCECGYSDFIETREGIVCQICGLVSERQVLVYNRPYDDSKLQNARLGTTQIGFAKERLAKSKSVHFNRLNKIHSVKNNEETTKIKAQMKIRSIFSALNLPESQKGFVFEKFNQIHKQLRPCTKYRSAEKLVPIVIYASLKLRNYPINQDKLLEVSDITKKEFQAFFFQIRNFLPEYKERKRIDYILQRVMEVSEHFELGMPFFYQSKKILLKFWEGIKNTKDDVIAGLVTSIIMLCSDTPSINISSICKRLSIQMSTIQSQVKKRLFDKFKIGGFVSLVKSGPQLKQFLVSKGLMELDNDEIPLDIDIPMEKVVIEQDPISRMIQIKLKGDINIYNSLRTKSDKSLNSYKLIICKEYDGHSYLIILQDDTFNEFKRLHICNERRDYVENMVLSYPFSHDPLKVFTGKGPPLTT